MSLSTKLIADYIELVNQYLDSIPVKKEKEFKHIQEALLSIVDPNGNHQVASSLKDRIESIQEMIDCPEIFVEDKNNYLEFKNIILNRVASKIQEIIILSSKEKIKYIENLKEQKDLALKNQSLLAERKPPQKGSKAYVISEEEMQNQHIIRRVYSILEMIFDPNHFVP